MEKVKEITLIKMGTLADAEYPQYDKYPAGYKKQGQMLRNEHPKVNEVFFVYNVIKDAAFPVFRTSTVTQIISETDDTIKFKTTNSAYKILIHQE